MSVMMIMYEFAYLFNFFFLYYTKRGASVFEHLFSIRLVVYLEVDLLGYMVIPC
jgi:hypothetical protein